MANDFLPLATGSGSNVITQAAYAALVARLTGFQAGVAKSSEVNKALRQATSISSMIGEFINDYGSLDALDNGDIDALEANFVATLFKLFPRALPTLTLYVRTDGNDANDGLTNTAGGAFATIAAAVNTGARRAFLAGGTLTIQLGNPGTYAAPGNIDRIGATIAIVGDVANQSSYSISGAGILGGSLVASIGAKVSVSGVRLINTGTLANTVGAVTSGSLTVRNVSFLNSVASPYAQILSSLSGNVTILDGCIFDGFAANMLNANGGTITIAANIVTTNTPAYSAATAVATLNGSIAVSGAFGFSGTGATGKRYEGTLNGVFQTGGGGANFFPGNASGSIATGAQYV